MPPSLLSDDRQHMVIRPLAYVREGDIVAHAEAEQFPLIPCNLCGTQENLQRRQVKRMLDQWERESPGRIDQIARALGDIRPSQLSDPKLFDFLALGRSEEHTSELQSLMRISYAVFCLKKKNTQRKRNNTQDTQQTYTTIP